MKKRVVITVPADPQQPVKVEAFGYEGSGCTEATAPIIQALGRKVSEQKKPEYYKIPDGVEQTQYQRENSLSDGL